MSITLNLIFSYLFYYENLNFYLNWKIFFISCIILYPLSSILTSFAFLILLEGKHTLYIHYVFSHYFCSFSPEVCENFFQLCLYHVLSFNPNLNSCSLPQLHFHLTEKLYISISPDVRLFLLYDSSSINNFF